VIFSGITSTPNNKDTNVEIIIKMRGNGELKTGLDNIKKCLKNKMIILIGENDNSNGSIIEIKNSNSISEVRVFKSTRSASSTVSRLFVIS
jgi:hypothetical protein